MKIKIIFKNGFELPVTCDKYHITINKFDGEIESCEFEGVRDNTLLFFQPKSIECIFQEWKGKQ